MSNLFKKDMTLGVYDGHLYRSAEGAASLGGLHQMPNLVPAHTDIPERMLEFMEVVNKCLCEGGMVLAIRDEEGDWLDVQWIDVGVAG